MNRPAKIGVIGDYNPSFPTHISTDEALNHAGQHLSARLEINWLPTSSLLEPGSENVLEGHDGFFGAPGSPYKSMEGALRAIRFARERNRPLIAT